MKQAINCRYCKLPIIQRKSESYKHYLKRKYHQDCKHKGMREAGAGFYDPMSYPNRPTRIRFVKGHAELEPATVDVYDV